MILKSIRLHPFGGTIDHVYDLARPVAVFLGPNEAGKTTMRQAIHHALFTTTKLTPAQAEAAVGRWYPRPAGDHAAVTLVFEAAGAEWTLTKRWGAGAACSLAAAGAAATGDAAAVQKKLAEFLGHNEATGRLVLYTGQTELARTVALLEAAGADEVPPVADVMAAAAGAAGAVGPERMRAAVQERIEEHFGRWDRAAGRPQLDKGKERGVAYPWERGAGSIVKAWYAWQGKVEELRGLREAEQELDRVSGALAALEADMAADAAFIEEGGPLRDGLGRRKLVELELQQLRADGQILAEIALKWPAAVAEAATLRTSIADLQRRKALLVTEQSAARGRAEAEGKKTEFAALLAARKEWTDADEAARKSFRPADAAVLELEQLAERIKDARNRIEAQRLAYEIGAREPLSIRIEEGDEPPRETAVGGGLSGVAKSRLRVEAGPVRVTVTSGQEDVDALFAGLRRDADREAKLLADCRAASLVDVKAQLKRHDELVAAEKLKKAAWESRLRGKAFEEWQREIDALATLPQTRDPAVIAAELAGIEETISTETGAVFVRDEHVRTWSGKYASQDKLLESLVDVRFRIQAGEKEIGSLPTVPEGFATAEAFLAGLAAREAANRDRPEQVKQLATRQQQLRDEVGDRTATDLAEAAEALGRGFGRTLRDGRAYERILEVLEEVAAAQEGDPLGEFTARVTDSFRRITGGADVVEFDDHLPTNVGRGPVSLPPDLLSQGAGSALALALRLALAEVHLGAVPGFIVLDDPFVDLDATRRERAKDLVRGFADQHQVIFLTCHEHHAAGL